MATHIDFKAQTPQLIWLKPFLMILLQAIAPEHQKIGTFVAHNWENGADFLVLESGAQWLENCFVHQHNTTIVSLGEKMGKGSLV